MTGEVAVVVCLGFGRWGTAYGCEQTLVVEPDHPLQGCRLHRLLGLPRRAAVDHLVFVLPFDGLGQCVVVAVALAANLRLHPSIGKPLAVPNTEVLHGL